MGWGNKNGRNRYFDGLCSRIVRVGTEILVLLCIRNQGKLILGWLSFFYNNSALIFRSVWKKIFPFLNR